MIHSLAPEAVGGCTVGNSVFDAARWADGEVNLGAFRDKRLGERLRTMLGQMAGAIGAPIPMACQDWANTKAAYRFLSNSSVNEGNILAGHLQATQARVAATDGLIPARADADSRLGFPNC